MRQVLSLAYRVESGAAQIRSAQQDLDEATGHLSYAELALRTFESDRASHGDPSAGDDGGADSREHLIAERESWQERVDTLRSQLTELNRAIETPGADDAVVTVALLYARIYELEAANSVDRKRVADRLGSISRFWAGIDRGGASFAALDSTRSGAAGSWLRERAVLGARMVQRDHDEGAPDSLLQAMGFNESPWQRADAERRRRGDLP
jgi:hypothetical protein